MLRWSVASHSMTRCVSLHISNAWTNSISFVCWCVTADTHYWYGYQARGECDGCHHFGEGYGVQRLCPGAAQHFNQYCIVVVNVFFREPTECEASGAVSGFVCSLFQR